jgi:hypothetical protein
MVSISKGTVPYYKFFKVKHFPANFGQSNTFQLLAYTYITIFITVAVSDFDPDPDPNSSRKYPVKSLDPYGSGSTRPGTSEREPDLTGSPGSPLSLGTRSWTTTGEISLLHFYLP